MRSSSFFPALLALLTIVFVAGCGGGGGGGTSSGGGSGPGPHLQFSSAGDIAHSLRTAAVGPKAAGADFEEGDLQTTHTYLFVLKNTGASAATDVVLSSSNPAVHVSPSTIGILQPEGAGGVSPVIQVTVEHGVSAAGAGYAPTLPAGRLQFTISATSAAVTASASVGMNVEVARFTATYHGNAVDLTGGVDGTLNVVTSASVTSAYAYYESGPVPADHTLIITNTGNVSLTLTSYGVPSSGTVRPPLESRVIAPGATDSVSAYLDSSSNLVIPFSVDSDGTEFDPSALPHAQPDGKWWAYMLVFGTSAG